MIVKERLYNNIVREIISLISSEMYADGQRLPAERKLCEQFHVSRGTVRKALADLETMGLIEIRSGSGAYVRTVNPKSIPEAFLPQDFGKTGLDDILVARKAIELAAVGWACRRITVKQLGRLGEVVEAMANAVGDLVEFLRLDMEFHHVLVAASGNVVLQTALEAINEYQKYCMIVTSRREGDEQEALDDHRRLLAAIDGKDAEQATEILGEHLDKHRGYLKKG